MKTNSFHAGGRKAKIDVQLQDYRRKMVKKYGDSFLTSIWISWMVSRKKQQFYNNLEELDTLYIK